LPKPAEGRRRQCTAQALTEDVRKRSSRSGQRPPVTCSKPCVPASSRMTTWEGSVVSRSSFARVHVREHARNAVNAVLRMVLHYLGPGDTWTCGTKRTSFDGCPIDQPTRIVRQRSLLAISLRKTWRPPGSRAAGIDAPTVVCVRGDGIPDD